MENIIKVEGDFENCPGNRLEPIIKYFSNFKGVLQICEHYEGRGDIKYNKDIPLIIFHSEGDESIIDIDYFSKFGTVLHCNSKINKGKFFNYWAYDYLLRIKDYKINLNEENKFSSKYLCLNGRPDWHRYYTIQKLVDENIYDKGLVSLLNRYNKIDDLKLLDKFNKVYKGTGTFVNDIVKNKKVLVLDRTNKQIHNDDRSQETYIYKNTSVSLVTETYPDSKRGLFVTEKSYKPLANCHFQIWIAQSGIVDFFRSLGFDVFDDVIDNGYDNIQDDVPRFNLAINSLKQFLKDIQSLDRKRMQNRLKENQKKYLSMELSNKEISSWL